VSTLNVDKVDPSTGTALEIGTSGDTITVPSGATFVVAGTTEITGASNVQRPNVNPLFLNGDMQIAQHATSVSGIGNTDDGYHTIDRWKWAESGTTSAVFTMSQDTDVPSGQGFAKSLKLDCTTADTGIATTETIRIEQSIEGQNLQLLKKGTANAEAVTLAFWVRSTKTGTYIVGFTDEDNNRIISKAYTIDSGDTWEKKILNYAGDTTDPFDNDNAASLRPSWLLAAGSSLQSGSLADAWQDYANANVAAGQVNFADSTSNNFYLTGVQLEVGTYTSSTIPPFQHESYEDNLARCQRYYYKNAAASNQYFGVGNIDGSNDAQILVFFPNEMRIAPTAIETNGTGTHYKIRTTAGVTCDAVPVYSDAGTLTAMTIFKKTTHGITNGAAAFGRSNNASAYLAWSAEL
jgi:hypothetical protein